MPLPAHDKHDIPILNAVDRSAQLLNPLFAISVLSAGDDALAGLLPSNSQGVGAADHMDVVADVHTLSEAVPVSISTREKLEREKIVFQVALVFMVADAIEVELVEIEQKAV